MALDFYVERGFALFDTLQNPYHTEFGDYRHSYTYFDGCLPESELRRGIGVLLVRTENRGGVQFNYQLGFDKFTGDPCALEIRNEGSEHTVTAGGYLSDGFPERIVIGEPLDIAIEGSDNLALDLSKIVRLHGLTNRSTGRGSVGQ